MSEDIIDVKETSQHIRFEWAFTRHFITHVSDEEVEVNGIKGKVAKTNENPNLFMLFANAYFDERCVLFESEITEGNLTSKFVEEHLSKWAKLIADNKV